MTDHALVAAPRLAFGDVEIDAHSNCIRRRGDEIHLRQKTFQVLLFLIANRHRAVSRNELFEAIWPETAVTEDTLVQCIVEIRKAVGDDSRDPWFVRTIPKVGYRFVGNEQPRREPAGIPAGVPMTIAFESVRSVDLEYTREQTWRWPSIAAAILAGAVLVSAATLFFEMKSHDLSSAAATAAPQRSNRLSFASPVRSRTAMTDDLEAYRLYSIGVERAQALRTNEAIALFNRAIARDPDFAMAHARIGYALAVSANRMDEARPHLEKALAFGDRLDEQERLEVTAWLAIARRDYAAAIEHYSVVIDRFPTHAEAYDRLGSLLAGEERFEEAADAYQKGLTIEPSSPSLHNHLGALYSAIGRHTESIEERKRYVALLPKESNAYDSLGLSYQAAGDFQNAIAAYQKAIALDPRFDVPHIHLGNCYAQLGRLDAATTEFLRYAAVETTPIGSARAYASIAWAYWRAGELPRAEAAAARAAATDPSSVDALLLTDVERNRFDRVDRFESMLISRPMANRGSRRQARIDYFLLAHADLRRGNTARALRKFSEALRYQPPDWFIDPLESCLADAYFDLGRFDDAAQEYERSLQHRPNQPLALYRLGIAYQTLGRTREARAQLERFLELWSTADRQLPQLTDAKARRDRLAAQS